VARSIRDREGGPAARPLTDRLSCYVRTVCSFPSFDFSALGLVVGIVRVVRAALLIMLCADHDGDLVVGDLIASDKLAVRVENATCRRHPR